MLLNDEFATLLSLCAAPGDQGPAARVVAKDIQDETQGMSEDERAPVWLTFRSMAVGPGSKTACDLIGMPRPE